MPMTQQLSGLQPAPRDRGRRSTMAMHLLLLLAPLPSRQLQQAAAAAASSAARPLALRQRPVQAATAAQPAAVAPNLTGTSLKYFGFGGPDQPQQMSPFTNLQVNAAAAEPCIHTPPRGFI